MVGKGPPESLVAEGPPESSAVWSPRSLLWLWKVGELVSGLESPDGGGEGVAGYPLVSLDQD